MSWESISQYRTYNPITFLLSFPKWDKIDDSFYFNLNKNKDQELAKRKVTFGQTFI